MVRGQAKTHNSHPSLESHKTFTMPPTMRRLTILENQRSERDDQTATARMQALSLMKKQDLSLLRISSLSGVPYTTCHRLKSFYMSGNGSKIKQLLDPGRFRAGGKPHLSPEQENIISERLIFAGRRGFASDVNDLRSLMAQTAGLSGRPYKNGLPSSDTIRLFRAKHREFSLRNYECKDLAKIKGERYEHVEPFFEILENIGNNIRGS